MSSFTALNTTMTSDIKTEVRLDDIDLLLTAEHEEITTSSPRKRGRKQAKENYGDITDEDEENQSPSKKDKKVNGAARRSIIPIPTSMDKASEEDKMMLRMRDAEKYGWKEIREVWEAMTGTSVGRSSLASRYHRLKANLAVLADEDEDNLVQAKKEVEERMELEKWHNIANWIEAKSGNKYPIHTLQKKFKDLLKKGATCNGTVVKAEFH